MKNVFIGLAISLLLSNCSGAIFGIPGEGVTSAHDLKLPDINTLHLDMPATVLLKNGPVQSISIEAQDNIFGLLNKTVNNGLWVIKPNSSIKKFDNIVIHITAPNVSQLINSSTGNIVTEENLTGRGAFRIIANGTGNVRVGGVFPFVELINQSNGSISLEGTCAKLSIVMNGIGDVHTFQTKADQVVVKTSSIGDCEVAPTQTLDVTVAGMGDVFYRGTPKITATLTGMGKLIPVN